MIEKNEIFKMATGLELNLDTVEKDYVLGWMLFGINQNKEISSWAFKGGTSLKKCFFETFRFSEDLDFTLLDKSQFKEDFLLKTFIEITDLLSEEIGITFFKDRFKFKIIEKENGKYSAQGKIHYNGPLRRRDGVASVKIDLTSDEIVVLNTEKRKVHHPYTDEPSQEIEANCYAFEEVLAEKIRALVQRVRPRDLYDVVHFFRNRSLIKNPKLVYSVLEKKCLYKKIEFPTYQHILNHEKFDELEPQWEYMLGHQLPNLPSFESFWNDLSPFFDWLNGELSEETVSLISKKDEIVFHPGRIVQAHSADFPLQKIQFAAANRVCIILTYNNKKRTVEPISFRKSRSGNRLFYGFEREANHSKAYSISKIQSVELTNISYTEKYPVEISSSGQISMPPIRRKSRTAYKENVAKFVYQCPICGKNFYRKKMNSRLSPHKDKYGFPCSGRQGIQQY